MTIAQIATDIADESECNVIEMECRITILEGVTWYDTTLRPGHDPAPLNRALKYLWMRDLLVRHETRPHLVRMPRACELGLQSLALLGC